MIIDVIGEDGPYKCSIIIYKMIIDALAKQEDLKKVFSTDFTHQYVRFGGHGNLFGLVTVDPEGLF
jgi:cellobiose-specific phosphotransferase system component IIC